LRVWQTPGLADQFLSNSQSPRDSDQTQITHLFEL
jgi:hypothetical protein